VRVEGLNCEYTPYKWADKPLVDKKNGYYADFVVFCADQSALSNGCNATQSLNTELERANAMPKRMNITSGDRFQRWTIIKEVESRRTPSGSPQRQFLCKCDCGTERVVILTRLTQGSNSCGCYKKIRTAETFTKHGMCKTPEYRTWCHMIGRCTNPKDKNYKDYGGRGINVCEEWREFENFYKDMGDRPKGMSLERKDNSEDYNPENCTWASFKKQMRNRRNTIFITYKGETKSICDWADDIGILRSTLVGRVRNKWSAERTLTEPPYTAQRRPTQK